jgi:hypothetical protein
MKKTIPLVVFLLMAVSVSSCREDADTPARTEVEIEEFRDGGQYSLESEQ